MVALSRFSLQHLPKSPNLKKYLLEVIIENTFTVQYLRSLVKNVLPLSVIIEFDIFVWNGNLKALFQH